MSGAKGVRAGRAFVEILAEDSALRRGLAKAQQRLKAFAASVNAIGNKLALAGAAVTGSLFGAFQHFSTAGDELSKMSDRTGVAIETLSLLKFAAEQSDASFQALGSGIQSLNKGLLKAEDGSGNVADALAELGLSAKGIAQLPADQKLLVIADRLAAVQDMGRRSALAMALFRGAGEEMLPLLNEGAAGIRKLMDEAERRGLKVSTEDARNATIAGDALASAWAGIKRAVFAVGAAVAPIFQQIAELISAVAHVLRRWIDENRTLVTIALYTGMALVALGIGLKIVGAATMVTAGLLRGVSLALGLVKLAISLLMNPIGLAVVAVVGLGTVILTQTSLGREALDWLGSTFSETAQTATDAWAGIGAAIAKGDIGLAVRIAMLGVQLEFTRAVNFLKKLWYEAWGGIKIFAINAGFGVAKGLTNAWSAIRQGWNWLTGTLSQGWSRFTGFVQKAWSVAAGFLKKTWARIRGVFDKSFDAKAASRSADDATKQALADIEARTQKELAEKQKAQREQADRIESERSGTVGVLEEDQNRAIQQVLDQAESQISDLEKQLADAKQAFQGAVQEAKSPAKEAGAAKGDDSDAFTLPDLSGANRQITQVGTFSANAAARLGRTNDNRIPQQQLATLQAIQQQQKVVADAVKAGGVVFAR